MKRGAIFLMLIAVGCADRPAYLEGTNDDLSNRKPTDLSGLDAGVADLSLVDSAVPVLSVTPPIRLLAPLSTSTATNRKPTFRWTGGNPQVTLEVCRERSCTNMIDSVPAKNHSARPTSALPKGVVFWRIHDGMELSPVWEVFIGARDSAVDNSYGSVLDVNGDGFADVGVGQLGDGTTIGSASVFLGGPTGLASSNGNDLLCNEQFPDWVGCWSVGNAGDLNGDGYGDFVVSSIPYVAAPDMRPGKVHVFYGGSDGASASRTTVLSDPSTGGQFGRTVGGAGDINGDGYGDLLVTEISSDSALHEWYIFYGGSAGVSFAADGFLAVPNLGRNTGESAAVGDLNGDGFGDIALSDDSSQAGQLLIYFGGPNGLSAPTIIPSPNTNQFGFYLTIADIDGDGYADVVSRGTSQANIAYVFGGGPSGISTITRQLPMPVGTGALAFAGDADSDGNDDLLMGSNSSGSDSPLFLLLSGSSTLRPLEFTSANSFSMTGVGDTNGDGRNTLVAGKLGQVYLFDSGSNDGGTMTLAPPDAGTTFGYSLAGLR